MSNTKIIRIEETVKVIKPSGNTINVGNLSLGNISGTLGIAKGGTGQTTANDALNALLPSQTSANGKYLRSDGSNASWDSVTPVVTNLQLNRVSKVYSDSPYTALTTDYYIDCDASNGSSTVNLYTAVGNTGREIVISKTDSSTNTITIDPNASETIAGLSTIILRTQYESITIKSNGTNWDIVSSNLGSLTTSASAYLPVFGCRAWVNSMAQLRLM